MTAPLEGITPKHGSSLTSELLTHYDQFMLSPSKSLPSVKMADGNNDRSA